LDTPVVVTDELLERIDRLERRLARHGARGPTGPGGAQGPQGPAGPTSFQMRGGNSTVSWPGGSNASNWTALWSVVPYTSTGVLVACGYGGSVLPCEWQVEWLGGNPASFQVRGVMPAGTNPTAGYARGFYWIAYGG
jgi:hypothetical protein